jgi:hypothetical protein
VQNARIVLRIGSALLYRLAKSPLGRFDKRPNSSAAAAAGAFAAAAG